MNIEFASLFEFHNSFYAISSSLQWDWKMVDCPECGKPMAKKKHGSKYYCENSSCSVIFVFRPGIPSKTRIVRKAEIRFSNIARYFSA